MSEQLRDQLGSGILLSLGIAGLALSGIIKWQSWRKKEIVLKKAAHCYNDYNILRNDLLQSDGALSNVIIQGKVDQKATSRDVEYETEDKHLKGVAQLDIVKRKGKDNEILEISAVPFILADNDGNGVTIENIHMSQGYYSLRDSGVLQQIDKKFYSGFLWPWPSQEERVVTMIKYGSSLAVLGDVTFRKRKGGEIVFKPTKVGMSVELLLSTKKP